MLFSLSAEIGFWQKLSLCLNLTSRGSSVFDEDSAEDDTLINAGGLVSFRGNIINILTSWLLQKAEVVLAQTGEVVGDGRACGFEFLLAGGVEDLHGATIQF